MTARPTSSRLEMLQARFQERQLQEKEQKLLQLYDQQQQRAYQVVQRASAGSNASNGSSQSHTSIASIASRTSLTASYTQGGKVRQMFDERRQTTKGIDRSYPLEPLDNKLKKDGELRKKVQRKDDDYMGGGGGGDGKTVLTSHDHESFATGPPRARNTDETLDENHHYHSRQEVGQVEEGLLDSETIERNRMMAKIHLLDFDDSMKHRVKNDLESEEFPEELMIDMPDKVPRKNPSRKVSESAARLQRFRNQNTKKTGLSKSSKNSKNSKNSTTLNKMNERTKTEKVLEKHQAIPFSMCSTPRKTLKKPSLNAEIRLPEYFCKESERSATSFSLREPSFTAVPRKNRRNKVDRLRHDTHGYYRETASSILKRKKIAMEKGEDCHVGKKASRASRASKGRQLASSALSLSSEGFFSKSSPPSIKRLRSIKDIRKSIHRVYNSKVETERGKTRLGKQPRIVGRHSVPMSTLPSSNYKRISHVPNVQLRNIENTINNVNKKESRLFRAAKDPSADNSAKKVFGTRVPNTTTRKSESTSATSPTSPTTKSPENVTPVVEGVKRMSDRRTCSASSTMSNATTIKTPIKTKSGAHRVLTSVSSKSTSDKATDNLISCKICGRRFAQDRIELHEEICMKTGQKKRKQFDTIMFRVKGTDLEAFVKKGMSRKQLEGKTKKPESKSNWRRKHEDFINAIRSAKQVQAHLAAGGKLSDLPPPPLSDTSDYIQCPHCARKFNEAAAERHIPKCQHMLHNKTPNARTSLRSKR